MPSSPRAPLWILPLFLFGLTTITLFGVNASRTRVYQRVEDMGVWLHRSDYGGSHYRLSANMSTITDRAQQERERLRVLERLRPQTYQDDREVAFLWERLARMRIEREDYKSALDAYRAALTTEPSSWIRKKPVGYLETKVGDADKGIQLLTDYLRQAPGDAEAWLFMGDACARRQLAGLARKS